MAKRKLKSFNFDSETLHKITRANLFTVTDLLNASAVKLMSSLPCSFDEGNDILKIVSSACLPNCISILEMCLAENNWIQSGEAAFDVLLQGGFKCGSLVEFAGPPGVGKTQWCLHMTVQCLMLQNSHTNSVCYIDTECVFKYERLLEILENQLEIENEHEFDLEGLLNRVHFYNVQSVTSMSKVFDNLELLVVEKGIRLIVVDSIASLARKEFGGVGKASAIARVNLLATWAAKLKALAQKLNVLVIVSNQVTGSKVNSSSWINTEDDCALQPLTYVIPSLGVTWTHFVNIRIILQYVNNNKDNRQLVLAKCPFAPVSAFNYCINNKGIQIDGVGRYTYSGWDSRKKRLRVQKGIQAEMKM